MNLNFIDLLNFVQLIAIQNRSDDNNINPQSFNNKGGASGIISFSVFDTWIQIFSPVMH